MGVLYDVLFKPIGRGDCSSPVATTTGGEQSVPPEWVLDKRDGGGPLVWRRHGLQPTHRKRVEFLDAVEVRVFKRDDCADDEDDGNDEDADNADDGQLFWTDDWSWDDEDGGGDSNKTLFYRPPDGNDYPLLFAASLTVLGVCVGLAYLFAPVKWLFHQLIVD